MIRACSAAAASRAALCVAALAVSLGSGLAGIAAAHPLDPALLHVRELDGGVLDVVWQAPRAAGDTLAPVLPKRCRGVEPPQRSDGERSAAWRWRLACGTRSLRGESFAVLGLDARQGDALLRIELADGQRWEAVLRAEAPSFTIPEPSPAGGATLSYGARGALRVLTAPQHLLFVVGLALLLRGRRELLRTTAALFVASSVGLALAGSAAQRLAPLQQPIELLIAGGTVLVALGLARRGVAGLAEPSTVRGAVLSPAALAFGCGALHGVALAAALERVPRAASEAPLALLSFNAGIELVVLGLVVAVAALHAVPALRSRDATRLVPAYAIGGVAMLWVAESVAALVRASV